MPLAEMASYDVTRDILRRVKVIEDHLGLAGASKLDEAEAKPIISPPDDAPAPSETPGDTQLQHLWDAVSCLERCTTGHRDPVLWNKNVIKYLWQSYEHASAPTKIDQRANILQISR